MKNLILIVSLFTMGSNIFCQNTENSIFDDNPPHQTPAIFAASLPPCIVGVANQYGEHLNVTETTLEETKALITEAHKRVPEFKNRVKTLELAILNASQEERYDDYERLIKELAAVKVEASLFHEGLVKKARKNFDAKDVEKLDAFIQDNKEVFLTAVKLN